MNVVVVIPVGPRHEGVVLEAQTSVVQAWTQAHGPFDEMRVVLVPDHEGLLGRSAARNRGMDRNPADWYFLMDADDTMRPYAFPLVALQWDATFGTVFRDGKAVVENRCVVDRSVLLRHNGARGTLSMGCFVRGDLGLRFDETLDVGEDFDFYLRLPNFIKRRSPLVNIGTGPGADGPRSGEGYNWQVVCNEVITRYRAEEGIAR